MSPVLHGIIVTHHYAQRFNFDFVHVIECPPFQRPLRGAVYLAPETPPPPAGAGRRLQAGRGARPPSSLLHPAQGRRHRCDRGESQVRARSEMCGLLHSLDSV